MLAVRSDHTHCSHMHTDSRDRRDPTGTTGIRRAFEAEITRRFKKLRTIIRQSIAENDALGLKPRQPYTGDQALQPRQFEFVRSGDKVSAFMEWLRQEQQQVILGTTIRSSTQQAWSNVYITAAYQKGIKDAGKQLRASGAKVSPTWVENAFTRPIHADRAGLAYTRVFEELEGINSVMDQQISRTLANGIAAGDNPLKIARDIANRVDKVGITRARTLARTEAISAHAEATLNSFEEAGIEGVRVLSEFATADDDLVCPICEDLDGREYTRSEARGVIPVHPNCRCAWIPVIEDGTGIELQ